ncbi:hypothetical protein T03_9637, partial [Trichinella britovi]
LESISYLKLCAIRNLLASVKARIVQNEEYKKIHALFASLIGEYGVGSMDTNCMDISCHNNCYNGAALGFLSLVWHRLLCHFGCNIYNFQYNRSHNRMLFPNRLNELERLRHLVHLVDIDLLLLYGSRHHHRRNNHTGMGDGGCRVGFSGSKHAKPSTVAQHFLCPGQSSSESHIFRLRPSNLFPYEMLGHDPAFVDTGQPICVLQHLRSPGQSESHLHLSTESPARAKKCENLRLFICHWRRTLSECTGKLAYCFIPTLQTGLLNAYLLISRLNSHPNGNGTTIHTKYVEKRLDAKNITFTLSMNTVSLSSRNAQESAFHFCVCLHVNEVVLLVLAITCTVSMPACTHHLRIVNCTKYFTEGEKSADLDEA